MDNPACNAYCLSNAEDRALAEAAEWARQTLPLSPSLIQAALAAVMYAEVELLTDTAAVVSRGGKPAGESTLSTTTHAPAPASALRQKGCARTGPQWPSPAVPMPARASS